MTDSIHSNILIVQNDAVFGHRIAQHLYKDRQNVIGPITKIQTAYKVIVTDHPNLAIIDKSICKHEIERLSDTLALMSIPHIINNGQSLMLTKIKIVEGKSVTSKVQCALPLERSIAHALWDMHVETILHYWLEDSIERKCRAA